MLSYTDTEQEEMTEQEAVESERYFKVRRHYQNYCDFMEEITNGNIIRD
mgnify:CR=1 FL=1